MTKKEYNSRQERFAWWWAEANHRTPEEFLEEWKFQECPSGDVYWFSQCQNPTLSKKDFQKSIDITFEFMKQYYREFAL